MTYYLTVGIILGLSAGFSPGPLLTLVISETLQHGIKSGIKIAIAPIIIFSVLILNSLSNSHWILGIISLIGSFFILYIGYESIRSKGYVVNTQEVKSKSLTKGILANTLNPAFGLVSVLQ